MSVVELEKKLAPNLRFFEFEGNWEQHVIGDFYKNLSTGMTPSRRKPKYFKGNIPWITSGELNYNYINSTRENITEEAVRDTNLKLYPKDTFFIAITGLEAPGTRGKCAMNAVPATTNQSCLAFTQTDKIETKFLYYWYLKYGIRLYYKYAQGTKQQSFNNKIVEQFKLTIPKKEEQQKIVTFLSAVDERIDLLEQKKSKLEEYKRGVMQKIFSQEIRFRNEDNIQYSDWKFRTLKELATFHRGSYLAKSDLDNSGTTKCIHYGELFTTYRELIKNVESRTNIEVGCLSQYGDILMPSSDVTPDGLAKASVILEEGVILGGDINIIRIKKNYNPIFLSYLLNFSKYSIIRLVSGSSVKHIYNKDLKTLKFKFPENIEEQNKIVAFLTAIDDKIELIKNQIESSHQFKKGLLQQMFV